MQWVALETRQVLLFCDYYTNGKVGAFSRSLSADLCGVDLALSSLGTTQQI